MDIEVTSTEVSSAADAKRAEASEPVEQKESVDSKESETTEESETSENESDSEESASEESSDEDEAKEKDEEEKEGQEKKSDLPKGVKKRIGRITKQRDQERQEKEYWKNEALKHLNKEPVQKEADAVSKDAPSDKPKAPNADDFADYGEYLTAHDAFVEALTDWKLEQREKVKEQKNKEVQAKTEFEQRKAEHLKRVNSFKEQTPDYAEVIQDFIEDHGDLNFSAVLEQAILESDSGPALIYELAKNPDELIRINSLGTVAAAREIVKLEAKLSQASSKAQPKPTTKAPAPPSVLGGKTDKAVKKSIFDPGLPFEEYERMRIEQMKQKGY